MKNETDTLKQSIRLLQIKRAEQLKLIKGEINIIQENIKPINLLKSTFQEITSSNALKSNIANVGIGLTTGYLSRKVLFGASSNPIKKILGVLLQFAVTNIVSKNTEGIKSAGENLLHRFLKHRRDSKNEFHHNGGE